MIAHIDVSHGLHASHPTVHPASDLALRAMAAMAASLVLPFVFGRFRGDSVEDKWLFMFGSDLRVRGKPDGFIVFGSRPFEEGSSNARDCLLLGERDGTFVYAVEGSADSIDG